MEIEVGGVDAMADLVQGTEELTVGDGAGDAGEIENEVDLLTRYLQSFNNLLNLRLFNNLLNL